MALKIYLDTQDYIALYKNRSAEQQAVYEYLQKRIASKQIKIGFSYAIIAEFLQDYEEAYREDRLQRAKLIKELCGKNCYRYIDKLNSGNAFSENGDWTPDFGEVLSLDKIKNDVIEEIIKSLPHLSSGQQKALKNKRGLKRLIKSNREIFLTGKEFGNSEIPLSEKFIKENMLIRFIIGELPRRVVQEEFLSFITDTELFLIAWFEYGKKGRLLYDLMHTPQENLRTAMTFLASAISAAKRLNKNIKSVERSIYKSDMPQISKTDLDNIKSKKIKVPIIDKSWIKEAMNSKDTKDYFPDIFWEVVACYVNRSLSRLDHLKDSDIIDIFHAIYIPYCDLWRGDKDFCSTLSSGNVTGKDKIVSKLSDLPDRIEYLLNETKN
tara:strand:+ start:398 stop:1540 length:1143 start_codon:yes stop_codon:yes gene_type:complete